MKNNNRLLNIRFNIRERLNGAKDKRQNCDFFHSYMISASSSHIDRFFPSIRSVISSQIRCEQKIIIVRQRRPADQSIFRQKFQCDWFGEWNTFCGREIKYLIAMGHLPNPKDSETDLKYPFLVSLEM